MPQVKNHGVSGRIGPVIFYYVGDKFYTRAAPGKIKQAPKNEDNELFHFHSIVI